MIKTLIVVAFAIIFDAFLFGCFYFSAHLQNSRNCDDSKMFRIKRFIRLCSFKDKQKIVVKYCYIMQVYSIGQLAVLVVILIGAVLFKLLFRNIFEDSFLLILCFAYIFGNAIALTIWTLFIEIRFNIDNQKTQKHLKE